MARTKTREGCAEGWEHHLPTNASLPKLTAGTKLTSHRSAVSLISDYGLKWAWDCPYHSCNAKLRGAAVDGHRAVEAARDAHLAERHR